MIKHSWILLFTYTIFNCSCKNSMSYELNCRKNYVQVEKILDPKFYIKIKNNTKLPIQEVVNITNQNFQKLLKIGIVTKSSFVIYNSQQCITLITPEGDKNTNNFTEYILVNNGNEGEFACSLSRLYSLNQNENITNLNISVKKINASINLFVVEGN